MPACRRPASQSGHAQARLSRRPPRIRKTSLGTRACAQIGLRFLDLSDVPVAEQRARLDSVIADRTADVVALSVELQEPAATFKLARRAGVLIGLWAHPLEMQARSGRNEPLFTPCRTLTTQGGFGREGTRCPEFRRLDRGCDGVLLLRDLTLDEAVDELTETLREIREEEAEPGVSLANWAKAWRDDQSADAKAAKILADAMGRYLAELETKGRSPRALSGIESDLQAAGMLVFDYEAPKGKRVLDSFESVPCESEYRRKFSDSPNATARYRRSVEGFSRFLLEAGLVCEA